MYDLICKGNTTIHAQKKMHFSYFFYTNFPNALCSSVCLFHISTTLSYIKTFLYLSTRHDMADKLLSLARNNNNNSLTLLKQDNTYYYKTRLHITCNWYYYMFWLNIKLMIYGNAKCSNNTLLNRNIAENCVKYHNPNPLNHLHWQQSMDHIQMCVLTELAQHNAWREIYLKIESKVLPITITLLVYYLHQLSSYLYWHIMVLIIFYTHHFINGKYNDIKTNSSSLCQLMLSNIFIY